MSPEEDDDEYDCAETRSYVMAESGLEHQRAGRRAEARRDFVEALRSNPENEEAMHHLGVLALQAGRVGPAVTLMRLSMRPCPGPGAWYSNLAVALKTAGAFDDALECYQQAIDMEPRDPHAHYNRAILLKEMGRLREAIDGYLEALAVKPDYRVARWNLALALLLDGQFLRGWAHYESRWERPDMRRAVKGPRWTGKEPIEGRPLVLWSEQGLGDTIQFCRYATLAAQRGARVSLKVQPELVQLLAGLRGVDSVQALGEGEARAELQCPLMSLPLAFGTTLENLPAEPAYLCADPARVHKWGERLGPRTGPRVGLAWSGSPRTEDRGRRSIPLARLAAHLPPSWECISLQKDVKQSEQASLARLTRVRHFGPQLEDFADTAALCEQVDLVIAVDTSVAHLAGALGKPVWLLLPFSPDWRWMLGRSDSPWYPSMRLWRQPRPGDWESVLADVERALAEWKA